jgi:peptide/nickel transport system permease protein
LIFIVVVLAILASPSFLPLPPPVGGDITQANLPVFARGHLLGTDTHGNDIGSRLLYGGRTSIIIAVLANIIGMLCGGTLGAISAYVGGVVDGLAMRVVDAMLAIPSLIIVLAVAQVAEPTILSVTLAMTSFSIPAFARMARSATRSLMKEAYMASARLNGTGILRATIRHIAPNIAPQLLTFALLGMASVITIEGALNFLGFGVPLPQPSWGGMIFQGQQVLSISPSQTLLPAICLFITILGFNLAGERMRKHFAQ